MKIETELNIGDRAMVKKGDRPAHLPEDENNIGKVIAIAVEVEGKKAPVITYTLEFNDPDTGKPDPDWNHEYEEDMLHFLSEGK